MNEIKIFANAQFGEIRTTIKDGEPWFVASDICRVLELGNTAMAIGRLEDEEKGVSSIDTLGGVQRMAIVSEAGLYALVIGSRKAEARQFTRWITHDVLPSIRKYGFYAQGELSQAGRGQLIEQLWQSQQRIEALEQKVNWLSSPQRHLMASATADGKKAGAAGDRLPEKAVHMYLDTLRQMISEGTLEVRGIGGGETEGWPTGRGEEALIGYADTDYLYVLPQKAYAQVAGRCREKGELFPVSYRILNRCLKQAGVITPSQTTQCSTSPKYIDGKSARLLWILREAIKQAGAQEGGKA